MLKGKQLTAALSALSGKPLAQVVSRYVREEAYEAGGRNALYDEGPYRYGQRFSPPRMAKGLYFAEDVHCAWGEATGNGLAALKPQEPGDWVLLNIEVKL